MPRFSCVVLDWSYDDAQKSDRASARSRTGRTSSSRRSGAETSRMPDCVPSGSATVKIGVSNAAGCRRDSENDALLRHDRAAEIDVVVLNLLRSLLLA